MLPMRSMVLSKSKPWKRLWWKCLLSLGSRKEFGVVLAEIFADGDEEAAGAAAGSQTTSLG